MRNLLLRFDPDYLIYVAAVDFAPIAWQLWCEICDEAIEEPTSDGDLADSQEEKHRRFHGF